MRLTHIKLAGFKSFTDPTTIHVPSQLVAVIGPNGCGKSNVIDAVRWVLGEASAKQLRGESMQDVIFNGAATRRPAPRASVELVFDNSDHSLQGAWGQYGEIAIKRQLTRQGESSYFINNQSVRRRDITDLFLGTGVGARGYAVIEQGMITRIIEACPEELRAYIEEAAGVSKYKERRRETETRLKDTREHLQRLADLQTELARQVEKLEKQAATAAQYQELSAELTRLENLLNYVNWRNSLAQADEAGAAHQAAQYQLEQFSEQHQEFTAQLEQLRETELSQQQQNHALNQEHSLLREQMARLEEQIRAQQNQQQRVERERLAAQAALQKIQQEQMVLQSEADLLENDLAEKQIELSELAVLVAEHEAQLPELEDAQAAAQLVYQSQQDELNRLKRELALKQQQLKHTQESLNQALARQARLESEQAALNLPDDSELSIAQAQVDELKEKYGILETQLQEQETYSGSLKTRLHAAQESYHAVYQHYLTAQAQHQALTQLLAEQPQQDFWAHTSASNAPVLWQNVVVPQDWQHAFGVVLAERLQARAVAEDFVLPDVLPQGSAAWTVSGSLKAKTQPAQALINQIQADKRFQAALQHWLDGVLCAPNLAYALANQHELQNNQLWLTPEGHRVDKLSVVLFNESDKNQLVSQKMRLDNLTAELAELAPNLQLAEAELAHIRTENNSHEAQFRETQTAQRTQAAQLQAAQNRANELFARTNQGQLRRAHIEQELAQLSEEIEHFTYSRDGLSDDVDTLAAAVSGFDVGNQAQDFQQQQNRVKQARLALLESNRQYGLAEIALHKQQQRLENVQQQLAIAEQQKSEWLARQLDLALADETADDGRSAELDTLTEMAAAVQEQIAEAVARLAQTQELARNVYAEQQRLAAQQPRLQDEVQATLLKQQEFLINAKQFHQHLLDTHADLLVLEESAQHAGQPETMSRNIVKLNQQIAALGAVNLAALEELAEAAERDTYYRTQSDDVQAAIALLEEAIAQIDDETKIRFKETFDLVQKKVQEFFPTLFGGGEASLRMEGDDWLTAGVSIMARPPGKKNSTIHLLSGGEKALTAMSLVFALFSLNPAPFCLLDEVDAPLDDANTSRFCNLVKEMSAQTQFLYISHNRLTMEMADQLIGVTMQEKGVSRIVAVDIQQALKMAES
ncbi:chromosome segregation protein SMC [Alysiella crassa]|uniref:Chromosome partition protein Smc n=1 Tax=Alysiella crassa TaxID=153491 RepID=A0A376BUG4_9NEIS|nr:chromosome segregation protein SMC [Alysiella crassa]UOP06126.1 chromosome segregation protein SMC [Alysiella crassa]SSY80596.1 Chromosome partition protein Smc [Alysiella crassa]